MLKLVSATPAISVIVDAHSIIEYFLKQYILSYYSVSNLTKAILSIVTNNK
jgi:hypothetical protein